MTTARTYTAPTPPLPSYEGRVVALDAVLAARDARVARQQAMLAQGGVLLSLTLVAPGAVKRSPLLDAIFAAALAALRPLVDDARARIEAVDDSGHHALYLLDGEARDWKTRMLALENRAPLSRLWDIDIIGGDGVAVSRRDLGLPPRRCLICDDDAKTCARERRHSINALQADITHRYRLHQQAQAIAETMRQALITEATLTPKAGLVDAAHNGGHTDMNLALFLKSADAIAPYLGDCAAAGMTFAASPASPAILAAIRPIGIAAEAAMRAATGGVNTHKGAIFAFGLTAAALGKRLAAQGTTTLAEIQDDIRAISAGLLAELQQPGEDSAGKRGYARHGIRGARGEAASGYTTVTRHALPAYRQALAADGNTRRALLAALVALYAANDDSTTLARVGLDGLRAHQHWARQLLADRATLADETRLADAIAAYARDCAARRLSAGGSADLLALTVWCGQHFTPNPGTPL
ncbi:citrate lyase holo-[acyl-carrier protein] synthase [Cardiobacterium hominis]|uniref:citrate lyase holo-[acyl-carrier protein] synthase n=1 Tax=Cardiobacterium hominis TaxID=2718 RepID=UPI00288AA2E7|nr:citrate lyase holo-[acyl-carrier protein] synthase [Cardiobacterium hominis]